MSSQATGTTSAIGFLVLVAPLAWTAAYGLSRCSGLLQRGVSAESTAAGELLETNVHVSVRSVACLRAPLETLFAPLIRLEEGCGPRRSEEQALDRVFEAHRRLSRVNAPAASVPPAR